jgi:hypothetical protein
MEKGQKPWSVPVAVEDIPDTGTHVEIEAPESARADLAKMAGLRALSDLSAVFDLTRKGAGVHVHGHVHARLGQTCVVTLEPLDNELEEAIDLVFAPKADDTGEAGIAGQASDDEDPPEPLVGGQLDLGAIATEFFLLGIDPYPRKVGAEFLPLKGESESARPFAALEALKKRMSRNMGGNQT